MYDTLVKTHENALGLIERLNFANSSDILSPCLLHRNNIMLQRACLSEISTKVTQIVDIIGNELKNNNNNNNNNNNENTNILHDLSDLNIPENYRVVHLQKMV